MSKVLVLNYKTLEFTEVEIKSKTVDLYEMYENINCTDVEHISGYNRKLDELHIGMWIDGEHKLKEDWLSKVSVVFTSKDGRIVELLAGNVMFAYDGKDGETYGLSDEQIKIIKDLFFEFYLVRVSTHKKVKVIEYDG